MEVKCLSVKNPFAYLICEGGKDIENRTWTTDFRGRIYIHASGDPIPCAVEKEYPKNITDFPEHDAKITALCKKIHAAYMKIGIDSTKNIPKDHHQWYMKGHAIIGYVDLIDVVEDSKSPWAQKGCYHWVLKNPVMLKKPIENVNGKLSLWKFALSE